MLKIYPKMFWVNFKVDNQFNHVSFILPNRYRHYGVYMTHEEDQLVDNEDVLRNPVVVLDRNSESYINLRYPVLAPPPPLTKQHGLLDSEVCATSFKIKFEDSV